ncbi:MAG: 7-cyano-7-deazaguanine synthase [Planctomycetes bacterium]|nr:7-cyano-7-deazaguanine synthase [Planctomycetota bacterium]
MNRGTCVLLYSGGLDSTLAALLLARQGWRLHALSILYDGRPSREIAAARALAGSLPFVTREEADIRGFGYGGENFSARSGPAATPGAGPDEGYIPFRNLIFWSLAAHRAAVLRAGAIAAGHTAEDGRSYNDASSRFFKQFSRLLAFPGRPDPGTTITVLLPLLDVSRETWWHTALDLSPDRRFWKRTWSCWKEGAAPCGRCFACRERRAVLSGAAGGA